MKLFLSAILPILTAREHHYNLSKDDRKRIPLSTFGYAKDGFLNATIKINAHENLWAPGNKFGFTFDKAENEGDVKRHEAEEDFMDTLDTCILTKPFETEASLRAKIDSYKSQNKGAQLDFGDSAIQAILNEQRIVFDLQIENDSDKSHNLVIRKTAGLSNGIEVKNMQEQTVIFKPINEDNPADGQIAVVEMKKFDNNHFEIVIKVYVHITSDEQAGLYEFNFHDCDAKDKVDIRVDFQEKNDHSFLSAGDIMLPEAYFFLFILFSGASVFWISVLTSNRKNVLVLHWLMAALVLVKAGSLLAHAMDYFYISKDGYQHGWATIFYITYLIRGVLLFFTLALIATGYSLVKGVLSENERKIFILVIPLQVIANIAYIVLETEEESNKNYQSWQEIAIFVDLICCGAIMFPIVWSIRHLGMATQVDGKGAVALKKLRLFKRFYSLTIAYIYITRVGGLLLKMALPFQLSWMSELLIELTTFLYFTFTGYTFRPGAGNNPYLKLATQEEGESLLTSSGATENLRARKVTRMIGSSDEDSSDEENVVDTVALIKAARENSSVV